MFENFRYNLKHNRKSVVKRTTATIIFGVIILVFVFAFMNPRNGAVATGGAAVEVNDSTISQIQFNDAMERMRHDPRYEQLQSLGGDAGRQILQQQALSQLVDFELLRQATDRNRIWTSDSEVRDTIVSAPSFQQEGHFSPTLYHNFLDGNRKTASDFEDEIRQEDSIRRTVSLFSASLKPLKEEAAKVKALGAMRANLEYVAVPTENLVVPETIPAAEEKTFLAQAGNEAKVKDYFDSHKADFSSPDRVKVRHILIRAKAGDSESEDKAKAKIEDLAKRAKTEDFGKLASQYSEDPGSKAKGGVIDYFSKGKMVPAFDAAAFSLPVNQLSEPIKTEYGYHLIQVLDKKPAVTRTLDEVKDEIAGILIAKDRARVAMDALSADLKKGDAGAVNKFVADHKLKWDETGPFSIESESVPKIGPNEEVVRIAFHLTPEHPLSDILIREGSRALVLRYKAAPPMKEDKKDDNAGMATEMAANRRSEDALRKWVEGLRKNARIATNPQVFGRGGGGGGSPGPSDAD